MENNNHQQHYKDPDTEERFYTTPFGDLPSVSTILSYYDDGKTNALMGWANKMMAEYLKSRANENGDIIIKKEEVEEIFKKAKNYHKEIRQQSAELGSETHNLIEVYLKGQRIDGLLEANPLLEKPFQAFLEWQKQYNFKLVASERQVCNDNPKYAGTLDCLAYLNDVPYVIDFKVSTAIRTTMAWQVSAYAFASKDGLYYAGKDEQGNPIWRPAEYNFKRIAILRLDKDTGLPEFKEWNIEEAFTFFDCFTAMCFIWWNRKNGRNITD